MISVIICTYNRASLLDIVLTKLCKQIDSSASDEIIVVDNNSSDNTREIVEKYVIKYSFVRYELETNQGLSHARNRGISESKNPYISFIDDDAFPEKDWLYNLKNIFFYYPNISVIGGRIKPHYEVERPDWLKGKLLDLYSVIDRQYSNIKVNKHKPIGANMAFKREVFSKNKFPINLGRVGNNLLSGEEFFLVNTIKKEGMDYYYSSSVCVSHFIPKERMTKNWVLERFRWEGISLVRACGKSFYLKWRLKLYAFFKLFVFSLGYLLSKERFLYKCKMLSQLSIIRER